MEKFFSKRLVIRDHIEDDLMTHHKLMSDKNVMLFLPDLYCESLNEARKHLYKCINFASDYPRKYYFFRIENRFTCEHIGEIGFTRTENQNISAGYFLTKRLWGNGYAREALNAVFRFAFIEHNVESVSCSCLKRNVQSENVMKACGMRFFRQYENDSGAARVEYRLSFHQWLTGQPEWISPLQIPDLL